MTWTMFSARTPAAPPGSRAGGGRTWISRWRRCRAHRGAARSWPAGSCAPRVRRACRSRGIRPSSDPVRRTARWRRAEPDGARALQARLERGGENQVPAAAERQPGQHVRLGVGERRAEYLPGGSFAVVHPVAGRADDLPGRGGGTSAHRDVPGPQRLPRLAERLLPRFIQPRPDPRRSSRRAAGRRSTA